SEAASPQSRADPESGHPLGNVRCRPAIRRRCLTSALICCLAGRPGGRGRRGRPGRGRRPHRPGVPGLRLAQPRRRPEGPAVRGRGRRRPVLQRRAVAPGPARRARELRALRRGRPALRHRVPARRGVLCRARRGTAAARHRRQWVGLDPAHILA
ncbi:unnamed protein product, partial [Prorocentrum cordatum]